MSEYYQVYQIWVKDKDDKSNPCPLWQAQTRWMLSNLGILWLGKWPQQPSNWIDPGGDRHVKAKAAFTTPIEWATELTRRLEMCHMDGIIVECLYAWDFDEQRLARYARTNVDTIRDIDYCVIKYISRPNIKGGYRRENHSYQ